MSLLIWLPIAIVILYLLSGIRFGDPRTVYAAIVLGRKWIDHKKGGVFWVPRNIAWRRITFFQVSILAQSSGRVEPMNPVIEDNLTDDRSEDVV